MPPYRAIILTELSNRFTAVLNLVGICWCGEIGRRKGLKIPRWQHRTGSSPVTSTTSEQASYRLLRLFSKVRARSCRCSSFSAKGRVRVACSLVNALTTALGSLPTFCGDAGQLHLFRSTLPVRVSIWTLGFLFLQFRYEHRYHVAANPYDKVWYTHGCPEFSCWNMHGTYLCMLGTNVCAIDF